MYKLITSQSMSALDGKTNQTEQPYKGVGGKPPSSAASTSCWFYKELDAILGGDPTSTVKATVDTLVACVPVESGQSQEEEILDEDVEGEGDPEAEDDLEVRDACSQELFYAPEETSHTQLSELGEAQTGEEAPDMTFGAQPPSLLSLAEYLGQFFHPLLDAQGPKSSSAIMVPLAEGCQTTEISLESEKKERSTAKISQIEMLGLHNFCLGDIQLPWTGE
ncbi:uncharacterized protein LOC122455510 [Dermochelys coriacea]|uniref:uncharacterized protein LOC122455510 n=1 Tax=Dermochelys coriacea TaxID=27794 RepID=UPI001CA7C229|nr:uncharacterized protein LOC122455510 [Dermochelys coriacea]